MVGKAVFIGIGLLLVGVAYYYQRCLFDGRVVENNGRLVRIRYLEKGVWKEGVVPAEQLLGVPTSLLPEEKVQVFHTKKSFLVMLPKKSGLAHTKRQRICLCLLLGIAFLLGGILA